MAHTPNYGIASGGLDGIARIWDLETAACTLQCHLQDDEIPTSIYTLHGIGHHEQPLLAAGRRNDIVIWDVRTGEQVIVLRCHSDMVRCLRIAPDGFNLLSGASDNCVTLSDLRMQKPVKRFHHHADSVWAMDVFSDWRHFISGARDGCVWHVNMETEAATLVAPPVPFDSGPEMILCVALCPLDTGSVWCSTTGSTIRRWPLITDCSPRSVTERCDFEGSKSVVQISSGDAAHVDEVANMLESMKFVQNAKLQPNAILRGEAAVTRAVVTNDRRHVITRDTKGVCSKYDVLTGKLVRTYDMEENLEEILAIEFEEVAISPWFTCDLRCGTLMLKLTPPSCFNAEAFGSDAGMTKQGHMDEKINLGELFLHNVFHRWKTGWGDDEMEASVSRDEDEQVKFTRTICTGYNAQAQVGIFAKESAIPLLRVRCGDDEPITEDEIPDWIVTSIVHGKRHVEGLNVSVCKLCFLVSPLHGIESFSDLPKLTAPKFLRMAKVKEYVLLQNAEEETEGTIDGEEDDLEKNEMGMKLQSVQIWCNGRLVPDSMSLATCAQFVWQKPGCIELKYSLDKP